MNIQEEELALRNEIAKCIREQRGRKFTLKTNPIHPEAQWIFHGIQSWFQEEVMLRNQLKSVYKEFDRFVYCSLPL